MPAVSDAAIVSKYLTWLKPFYTIRAQSTANGEVDR
jgi:hypothetical protein